MHFIFHSRKAIAIEKKITYGKCKCVLDSIVIGVCVCVFALCHTVQTVSVCGCAVMNKYSTYTVFAMHTKIGGKYYKNIVRCNRKRWSFCG